MVKGTEKVKMLNQLVTHKGIVVKKISGYLENLLYYYPGWCNKTISADKTCWSITFKTKIE